MFLIQNTLVSLDVLEKEFCCDLDVCRGCCCIEGDAGAPLTAEEEGKIQCILPVLLPDMTKEAKGFTHFMRKDAGLALGLGASATDPKFGDNKCNK